MMEHIRTPKVENVRLIDRGSPSKVCMGTLYLTGTHTIFVENAHETHKETWVLHSLVCGIERPPVTPSGCPLLIRCKNFQVILFLIPKERDCQDVQLSLARLSRPERYGELYCFSFNPKVDPDDREAAWTRVDLRAEYCRMGVPNHLWQITHANSEYRASICRSSQPLTGFSARCLEDEQMLEAIMKSNPGSQFMYVVDTRPKLNAMANRATGKGYENEDNYSNIKFQFIGIENIHVMRSSLQKIVEVCELKSPSMSDFLWGLESSGWLKHIKAIMDAGIFIAKAVAEEGISVLVHCSDGWDRTAQACSVASVLLDPYYRTLKGFMVLIEKDWVSFGHKFSHRYSHLDGDPKEVSPVLDQFLECVWQLTEQFPCAFQYNERFLLELHTHIYSCQYGNFLGNSEKERRDLRIRDRTHSLWAHLWQNRVDYTNPLYRPDHSQTQGVLRPMTTPYYFKFWRGMYSRSDKRTLPRQSAVDYLMAVKEETQQLEDELAAHEQKIAKLGEQLGKRFQPKVTLAGKNDVQETSEPQDDRDGSPSQQGALESSSLILPRDALKSSDPDLSVNSDQESGVADLNCLSPIGGEESVKDPYSEEAAYATA
ncbi:hypothetical protein JZ751_016427 [Albula glossodonta]|uniref:Myotubularin phosphatase domain-containing protein n=1 Tax=Albula glossodonta TaxID=121402 RepID=A0A8T2NPX5_9TELE|nr:hypothetical protein JZ751_016427 [Albula glossodonta]